MNPKPTRCLILACGNTLRSDDGIGPWLADWAAEHFTNDPPIRIISRQQWTPDLAADIAAADNVLFLDCSLESAPGAVQLRIVQPLAPNSGLATHHACAAELLSIAQQLYGTIPSNSLLLTVGAGAIELRESFSPVVLAAVPEACRLIEESVRGFLG